MSVHILPIAKEEKPLARKTIALESTKQHQRQTPNVQKNTHAPRPQTDSHVYSALYLVTFEVHEVTEQSLFPAGSFRPDLSEFKIDGGRKKHAVSAASLNTAVPPPAPPLPPFPVCQLPKYLPRANNSPPAHSHRATSVPRMGFGLCALA